MVRIGKETTRLTRVVSLRELMVSDRSARVADIGDPRPPISVKPLMDREDMARLTSKYDLLAVPVLDDGGRTLGIVTVDDVIDAIVQEQTEDSQKFGGHGSPRRALHEDRFRHDDPEARGLALRPLPQRDADGHGHAVLRGGTEQGAGPRPPQTSPLPREGEFGLHLSSAVRRPVGRGRRIGDMKNPQH